MSSRKVLWLSLVLLALSQPFAYAAGPRLELDPPNWEMGEIYQWTNPSTTIKMKNTGDAPLHIIDVKASCGCTAVVLSEKVIPPGGTGEMKIDFASYNFSGPVNKIVKLTTDEKESPEKVIRIKGSIKPDQSAIGAVEPGYVDLGIVAPYETRYFDITIQNRGNADLPVTGVDVSDGLTLGSAYPGKVAAYSSQNVRIGYKPPVGKGPIDGRVTVHISYPGQEDLVVLVAGYVGEAARGADSLVVTPAGITVRAGSAQSSVELAVKNAGGDRVLVEDADSSLDGVTPSLTAGELGPGESGTVSIAIDPARLKPGTKGYIYLRLAVPVSVEAPETK